jgi:preprotein translocase subunit SecG
MGAFFGIVLALLAIFLILLVLVQRGRGGGLAGALGGMGGSSAFGAKAGDVFTRITVVVVAIWITICILAGHWARNQGDLFGSPADMSLPSAPSVLPPVVPLQDLQLNPPVNEKSEATTPPPVTNETAAPADTTDSGAEAVSNTVDEKTAEAPPADK